MLNAAKTQIEGRKKRRRRVTFKGEILVNYADDVVKCLLLDMSENGARLNFEQPTILPSRFKLKILKTRETKDVRIVWRSYQSAGVVFDNEI